MLASIGTGGVNLTDKVLQSSEGPSWRGIISLAISCWTVGIITSELSYLYLNTLYGPTKIQLNGCTVQPLFHVVVFHKVRYAHRLGMVSHFGAVLLHDN